MTRPTGEDAMSNETKGPQPPAEAQPEVSVVWHELCDCPNGRAEHSPSCAALAAAQQQWQAVAHSAPPSAPEAQGGGEVFGWVLGDAFVDARFWTAGTPPQGWTPVYLAPPSAPVGVEGLIERWKRDAARCKADGYTDAAIVKLDCAQQLANLAQQPAAVDEVRIPRKLADRVMTALGKFTSDEGWSAVDMETADDFGALAGQQGGSDNDR